jgi:hypothetical protein
MEQLFDQDTIDEFKKYKKQELANDPMLIAKFSKGPVTFYAIDYDEKSNRVLAIRSDKEEKAKWYDISKLQGGIFNHVKIDRAFPPIRKSNMHLYSKEINECEPKLENQHEKKTAKDNASTNEMFTHENSEKENEFDLDR